MNHKELGERITELAEVKKIEVEVLDAFVSFCEENHLTYFLAYGTLLGAVRHKGFIPWDDDIDVTMPRPDYQKLLELWPKEGRYTLLECNQDKGYLYPFAKVCDSKTFIEESGVEVSFDMGIYIDIFPLDGIQGTPEENKRFLHSFETMEKCRMYSMMPCESILKEGTGSDLPRKLLWQVLRKIGPYRFSKRMDRLARKNGYSAEQYGGFLSTRFWEREIYPLRVLEDTIKIEFEGKWYTAPADYHLVLTLLYGDYMQLPPEDEQVLKHNFKAWRCR